MSLLDRLLDRARATLTFRASAGPAERPVGLEIRLAHAGFVSTKRTRKIDTLVVHESVTNDLPSTVAVLKRRGCGVHYAIDAAGACLELAPADARLKHAGGLNGRSIAIEIVTPFYAAAPGRARAPWQRTIPAPWAHRGEYTLPLPAQLATLHDLVGVLIARHTIPAAWPGLRGAKMALGLVPGASDLPGIHAHHYTAHSDGAFPVLYLYLRRVRGLGHQAAYDRAVELATGARGSVSVEA